MPLDNETSRGLYLGAPMGRRRVGGAFRSDYRVRGDGVRADRHGHMWDANGAPFLKMSWRAQDVDVEEEYPVRDIEHTVRNYVEDYKVAMIRAGRENEITAQLEAEPDKVSKPISGEVAASLKEALASKDSEAMAKALNALEEFDPKERSLDERIEYFKDELSNVWKDGFANDHTAATVFVMETLKPNLPEPLQEIARDARKNREYEQAKSKALQLSREGTQGKFFTSMADTVFNVVQTRSSDDTWESKANFGGNPGVYFGSHCGATWGLTGGQYSYGSFGYPLADPAVRDFDERYAVKNEEAIQALTG